MIWLRVDPQSEQPIFQQIAYAVKQAMARGDLQTGDRLPSVRDLARDLTVNPNTVVHAYELLATEGVLVRRQGAGCFISSAPSPLASPERRRQLSDLIDRTVTEAFHLGFGPDEIRRCLENKLKTVQFPTKRREAKT